MFNCSTCREKENVTRDLLRNVWLRVCSAQPFVTLRLLLVSSAGSLRRTSKGTTTTARAKSSMHRHLDHPVSKVCLPGNRQRTRRAWIEQLVTKIVCSWTFMFLRNLRRRLFRCSSISMVAATLRVVLVSIPGDRLSTLLEGLLSLCRLDTDLALMGSCLDRRFARMDRLMLGF